MKRFHGTSDEIAQLQHDCEDIAEAIKDGKSGKWHDIADELEDIANRLDELATEGAQLWL